MSKQKIVQQTDQGSRKGGKSQMGMAYHEQALAEREQHEPRRTTRHVNELPQGKGMTANAPKRADDVGHAKRSR